MRWMLVVAATLAVAICLAVGVLFLASRQERHPQDPNLQPLTDSLKQRMDDLLGASDLTESTVELSVMRSQLESEVARVKYLATKLGGSAVSKQSAAGATMDLVAEIPLECRKSFIDAVTDGFKDLPEANPGASPTMCVVTVQIKVQS
ncbi:MAG: hypothetical protein JOZ08_19180 [Verrucomicrobia bacterium]|nr:hypothetical protein [Verrucomicrobiota bacterium]